MKAFLKFHRIEPAALLCLRSWLEVFRYHDTYIICDHYNPKTDQAPDYLKSVLIDYKVTVINSDYSIGPTYCKNMKGAKHKMASANMTPFQHTGKAMGFWIIDADDTWFLTYDYVMIRNKIKAAEEYFMSNNLDAFSLDFYRNLNDCWTFGVCLLRSQMPWTKIKDLSDEEVRSTGLARNIDTVFDILGKKGIFKIKNFVFRDLAFQHLYNNYPEMPHGIYSWNKQGLWNKPLKPDVIAL